MRITRVVPTCISLFTFFSFSLAINRRQQAPMIASPIPQDAAPAVATEANPLLLADTISSQRPLSIFASLARDDMNTSAQFADQSEYLVVLAPTNGALKAMSHKPWEDPDEMKALGGHVYKGEPGMDRAQKNIRAFVQNCLVRGGSQGFDWPEGEKRKRGEFHSQVWWEMQDGKRIIMPEKIAVEAVVSRVANGEIWALEETFKT